MELRRFAVFITLEFVLIFQRFSLLADFSFQPLFPPFLAGHWYGMWSLTYMCVFRSDFFVV